jgi:hypothetical protein
VKPSVEGTTDCRGAFACELSSGRFGFDFAARKRVGVARKRVDVDCVDFSSFDEFSRRVRLLSTAAAPGRDAQP